MGAKVQKAKWTEQVAEMRAFALQLRKDGHSYAKIGILLGSQFAPHPCKKNRGRAGVFSEGHAHKLVKEAIKSIYRDDANDLIRLEMQRLDDMQLEVLNVLRTTHVTISSGCIVHRNVMDSDGRFVMNPLTGLPVTVPIEDDAPKLASIDRLLKIQERRARLLGLDKPTKVAPTNPDGSKEAKGVVIVASPIDQAL